MIVITRIQFLKLLKSVEKIENDLYEVRENVLDIIRKDEKENIE